MNLLLSLASAGLAILIFPDFNLRLLAPVALTPLLIAASREAAFWRRFLLGEVSGIVYWGGVCHWIEGVLENHGGMAAPLAWFSFAVFCTLKGLHTAVFTALAGPVVSRWWALPGVAALWSGIERLHGKFGFAWLMLGNAGIDMGVPLRLAPAVGVYGVSFAFAMMGAAVALVFLRARRSCLYPLLALPALYVLPEMPEPLAGQDTAVAVQGNAPQSHRWTQEQLRELVRTMGLLSIRQSLDPERPLPTLLLWPESPAPLYFYSDPDFQAEAKRLARTIRTHFLFGTVAYDPRTQAPLNRALLLNPYGEIATSYDKMYLVPFGEFVPPVFSWVNRITQEAGDFQAGRQVVVSRVDNHTLGTVICYESAFPELVRRFVAEGAELVVNISNDGYFGRSAARGQHVLLARMRAAENRRWLLRSTNDGFTVAIDPGGRITDTLPPYEANAGRLNFNWIPLKTPYTTNGDWFAWSSLGLGIVSALLAQILPNRSID
jgi:apolipoprotein N-acyltransferase